MPISRRLFVKTASVAAIVAGTMGKSGFVALAQQLTDTDPLSYYTQDTFTQYVNSVFSLHRFRTVELTLVSVQDTLPAKVARVGGRESFVLTFAGGSYELPQDTYTLEHPALGTFQLFLVPSGPDKNGAQHYVATINRLEYTAKPGGTLAK